MPCSQEYQRQYYLKNKERILAKNNEWAKNNPDKIAMYAQKVRAKRKEQGKDVIVRKRWEAKHREYILWNAAKQRCKKTGVEFSIQVDDISIPSICPFLEIPIDINSRGRMNPNSPSLDRIDNNKGYVPGNIQVISWQANRMKSDASIHDLVTFAKNILKWTNRG
jgi:predicted Zn-ribbon and HTH transcriptional regulator